MPEKNAPGVYVEEASPNPGPIQGATTSTTAFAGLTGQGPVGSVSAALTSFGEFEAAYGSAPSLQFPSHVQGGTAVTIPNYMALAARAFFENGGQRLYVSRVAAADGSNNFVPTAADYRKALATLVGVKDISIVAAPGSTVFGGSGGAAPTPAQSAAILAELIAHVSQGSSYRFAVLDTPPGYSSSDVKALRSQIDSSSAALYYPWVMIANPPAPAQMSVPPSGFVCGIYARTDIKQGVFKAPANQQVMGAVGLERAIQDAEGGALNALGINCLRSFPGRGELLWGARTISSDPEWKYVNVRRYVAYLEHSIEEGTQWVVFEPNGPTLWAAIRNAIQNFLLTEWRRGGLLGMKATDAFFVKCDTTTMTQNDIDNGRVICFVGVALIKPAEFVIFRIGWQGKGASCAPS
jgi:phage tail sheath protein FI